MSIRQAWEDPNTWGCTDCPKPFHEQPYYMVHNHLWAQATAKRPAHFLCLSCLCARLGRKLTLADLPDLIINTYMLNGYWNATPEIQAEVDEFITRTR